MTREQYIQLVRMIITQEKIDTLTDREARAIQRRYGTVISQMFDRLQNAPELARQGISPQRFEERLLQIMLQSDMVDLAVADISSGAAAVGDIAYPDYNNMLSWDGRVPDYNRVMRSALEIREQVVSVPLGGKVLSQWVEDSVATTLSYIFETSRMQGLGYEDMVRQAGKEFREMQTRELTTLARTYNQAVATQAQNDVYKANRDIVKEVEWSAVLETGYTQSGTGTCERCAALDGNRYDVDENNRSPDAPPCPLHPRCRCLLLPITPTWRDLGFDVDEMEQAYRPAVERVEEAIDLGRLTPYAVGFVDKDYSDWWYSQDKTFQDNVVGPWRANAIRAGYVDFKSIVNERGDLIPIVELGLSQEQLTEIRKRI